MTFKSGNIIQYNGNGTKSAKKGAHAVVVAVTDVWVSVCWLDELANGQSNGSYYPTDFDLVAEDMRSWHPSKVGATLTPQENMERLDNAVQRLRAQGYTVSATVTEPPVFPVTLKF